VFLGSGYFRGIIWGMYRVETEEEVDPRWIAEGTELPGVLAYGATREEAVRKAQALSLRVLAERLENGEPSPRVQNVFSIVA
jgi:predicted RNase H-like HicB family nuclease